MDVRECEDSSLKGWTSEFCKCLSCEKLTREKATCRAHDWKMKSHASLEVFTGNVILRSTHETFYLAKNYVLLYQVFTHTIYTQIDIHVNTLK